MSNSEEMWGSDDEEVEMLLSAVYEHEEKLQQQNQQHLVKEKTEDDNGKLGTNSSGISPTQTDTTQILEARRQALVHNSYNSSCRVTQSEPINVPASPMASKEIMDVHSCNLLAEEIAKNKDLSTKMLQNQGENALLRKQMEKLKIEQHILGMERKNKEREEKQKYVDEKRKFELEISALKTSLSVAENELINYKSKAAMHSVSPKLSIGGASQSNHRANAKSQMVSTSTSAQTTKYKSDPNLRGGKNLVSSPHAQVVSPVSHPPKQIKKEFVSKPLQVQVNQEAVKNRKIYEQVFDDSNTSSINFGKLIYSTSADTSERQHTFDILRNRVDQKFLSLNPVIKKIVHVAPSEIKLTFVPDLGIKEWVPDVIDSMSHQFINEERAKRDNEINGESTKKKYPMLPSERRNEVLHYEQVESKIQSNFVNGSAWEALREIKMHIKSLLTAIEGDMRFTLYEAGNVTSFLKLLVWTKYLWKFIVTDEELADINTHGKRLWSKELREWTGLILKADWRDLYVPELETAIRQQTLAILESIVSLGYFEQQRRRNEILYRILKDTLEGEIHRSVQSFKHCINIISWSIADKSILNYLCMNQNHQCLAYILGENVLKCFKEIKNPYLATDLFVHYVNLLFALELPQSHDYFVSSIARPDKDGIIGIRENVVTNVNVQPREEIQSQMDVDVSFDCDNFEFSQFSCPGKYTFDEVSRDRVLNLGNGCNPDEKKNNKQGWINPQRWELPSSAPRSNSTPPPCQCRKLLLGNAFTMLHGIFQFWKQTFTTHDRGIEKQETLDAVKLEMDNEDTFTTPFHTDATLISKSYQNILQNIDVYKKINDIPTSEGGPNQLSEEWTWDGILQHQDLMIQYNNVPTAFNDKERPDRIFDYAIRRGLVLMNFCEVEIQGNKAQALGSEPFWYFTRLPAELRFYEENVRLTNAEKSILSNLVALSYGDQMSVKEIHFKGSSVDDDDYGTNEQFRCLPRQLNSGDCRVECLPDSRNIPRKLSITKEEWPESMFLKLIKFGFS